MVRVTFWLQLLLVVLILRQSAAVSDQSSKQQKQITYEDILKLRDLKDEIQRLADNCHVSSYIKICSFCKLLVLLSNNYVTVSWVQTYINCAVTAFDCNICVVSFFRTQCPNNCENCLRARNYITNSMLIVLLEKLVVPQLVLVLQGTWIFITVLTIAHPLSGLSNINPVHALPSPF